VYVALLATLEGGAPEGASPFRPTGSPIPCFDPNPPREERDTNNTTSRGQQPTTMANKWQQDLQEQLHAARTRLGLAKGASATNRSAPRQSGNTVDVATGVHVFSGPVTVTSKTHKTQWKQGWVDYKFAIEVEQVSEEQLAQAETSLGTRVPRVKSADLNKYKLQLFRRQDY
jgi:hypothetical protein